MQTLNKRVIGLDKSTIESRLKNDSALYVLESAGQVDFGFNNWYTLWYTILKNHGNTLAPTTLSWFPRRACFVQI